MSESLEALKRQFIVPIESIVDLVKPIKRQAVNNLFYCPYAPCCSDCRGVFTFRETLDHLRRIHQKDIGEIKLLVRRKLPRVPERGIG